MRTPVAVASTCLLGVGLAPACDAPAVDDAPPREVADGTTAPSDGEAAAASEASGAQGTDRQREVEAVVRGLFDAMRDGDSAAARALFHPEARLSGPVERDGEVLLRASPVGPFLDALAGAQETWDERIDGLEIRVDGRLAAAWMDYVFRLGGDVSHCGVNAMQLYRSATGWKIFQIADTRRTDGCPDLSSEAG